MKTATTALGGILASIAVPVRVPPADSRRQEARANAGQGSAQAPRSGWRMGALSALWRLPARYRRGRKQDTTANSRVTRSAVMLAAYVGLQLGSVALGIAMSHKPAATPESVVALADAPKLPIDISEAF